MKDCCLWIVIPCYNEEEVIPITAPQAGIRPGISSKIWHKRMNALPEYVRAETADIRTLFWQD